MNINHLPGKIINSISNWLAISDLLRFRSSCTTICKSLTPPYSLNFKAYKQSIIYFNSLFLKQKLNQIIRLESLVKPSHEKLVYLVQHGQLDILRILKQHVYPESILQACFTIAASHSEYYHGKIAYHLLKAIPALNINLPSHPLICASISGNPDLVDLLLTHEIPASTINCSIVLASRHNRPSCLKSLLSYAHSDPSHNKNEAIRLACTNGHLKPVKLLLLDPRVDPSSNQNESLRKASENGYLLIVILLLRDPRVISIGLETSLHLSQVHGNAEVARYLFIEALKDLGRYGVVCLKFACKIGDPTLLRKLLEKLDLDEALLFIVVKHNRIECLEILLEHGIDPSIEGNRALKMANQMGFRAIFELLLKSERVIERQKFDKVVPEKWITNESTHDFI